MSENQLLSPFIKQCVQEFSSESWRERKQAIERMIHHLDHESFAKNELERLSQILLDLVVSPDTMSARAACLEVLVHLGRTSVPFVLERVRNGSEGARLLVDLLASVGTKSDVPELCRILQNDSADENLRASIAAVLGAIGGSGAISALTKLLNEESAMLRLYALDGLQESGAKLPIGLLRPHLERPITRKASAVLLGECQSYEAVGLLVPLVSDRMRSVRKISIVAIAKILKKVEQPDTESPLPESRELRRYLSAIDQDGKEYIQSLILDEDHQVACAAIDLAGMLQDERAFPNLVERMNQPIVYEHAIDFVRRLGTHANAGLLELVKNRNASDRSLVFALIGSIAIDDVCQELREIVESSLVDGQDDDLVQNACEALKQIGQRSSLENLFACCKREGELGEVAADALAAIALRLRGDRYGELLRIVGGSWPQEGVLAHNMCRVIGNIGTIEGVPALVTMIGSTDPSVRAAAATAMGKMEGDHEGITALCFALADEEAQVRSAACRSLGHLKAPQSCHPLLSATEDPNPVVRATAVQAVVAIDNPIAYARLREIILDDESPSVVVHAIAGLSSSGADQDLGLLMSLCQAQDTEVIKAAARALTCYTSHRATAALLGLLSSDRWDVRWVAAESLSERNDLTALIPLERTLQTETDPLVLKVIQTAIDHLSNLAKGAEAR